MSTDAAARPMALNYFALSAFWFGTSFHWFLLLIVLIPADVLRFAGDAQKGTYLGLLLGIGAIVALIMPPLVGAYSDRIGKRLVFLRWGVLVNVIGVGVMAVAPSFWPYVLGFLLVQFGNNLATSPYAALIPELVPREKRGRASGAMGLLQLVGQLAGGVAAFLLVGNTTLAYVALAVVLTASATLTLLLVPEPPERPRSRAPAIPWALLFAQQAFLWVFVTRALFSFGQYSVQPFLQYYLRDVVEVFEVFGMRIADAATANSALLLSIVMCGAVSSILGGRLSDRVGRKPVMYFAGGLMAVTAVLLLFVPSFGAALAVGATFGLGYGAFTSVDWALGSDAMPSEQSYARDMGVWHVAFVAPQLTNAPQGLLLDWGNAQGGNLGYLIVFGVAAACFTLGVILVSRIPGVK